VSQNKKSYGCSTPLGSLPSNYRALSQTHTHKHTHIQTEETSEGKCIKKLQISITKFRKVKNKKLEKNCI
jgi:hypothetical protein